MSGQPVKRLSSLEIDEVSLVDRPANQHGLVTITKRDEGTPMGVYDEQGRELDETTLQSGDTVFDENGEPILLLSDEDQAALLSGELDPAQLGLDEEALTALLQQGAEEENLATVGKRGGGSAAVTGGRTSTVIQGGRKLRTKYAQSAPGRRGQFGKAAPSLSEQVLSELSKALTDGDRDTVIAKMADRVSESETIAKAAQARLEQLEDQREFEQFVEVGKSFQLPVDEDELGGILQAVSKVLTDEQLETFERILNTAAAAVSLEEAGSAGYSPTMDYVEGAALEVVGKSAGDLTVEQATTALYSENDEAYLAYLSENQR